MESISAPSHVDEKALQALEWAVILKSAAAEARSEPGQKRVELGMNPENWAASLAEAKDWQQETQEAVSLKDRGVLWGALDELFDPEPVFDLLERGGVPSAPQLALLRSWLQATEAWTQVPREDWPGRRVRAAVSQLMDPFQVLRILSRVLTAEGAISENASPEMARLCAEARSIQREIGQTLDTLVREYEKSGILQESFVDRRDGRYVIPVKVSQQSQCEGIVYDLSASRQTVFIEPRAVERLNNRLRKCENEREEETYRVLSEVAHELLPRLSEIRRSVGILAHWDAVTARARFAARTGGRAIEVIGESRLRLADVAHPLLWNSLAPEKIIRNAIELEAPARAILLSGPNAGGKTVLLKTLGVAAIFARTGFFMPGALPLQVPFFDRVFVDLGDPQSISGNLSSFSGHLMKLKDMLEGVSGRSLLLIDELNTATDPEEGSALARAFLDTIFEQAPDAILAATTHDPRLKTDALSDPRVLSASLQFDESKLEPTYRVVYGIPGRSRAIELAQRLGFPEGVLRRAREALSGEHTRFERALSELESKLAEAVQARDQAVRMREEAEKLLGEWRERSARGVEDAMDRVRRRLKQMMLEANEQMQQIARKFEEARSRKDLDRKADAAKADLARLLESTVSAAERALKEEAPELVRAAAENTSQSGAGLVSADAPGASVPSLRPSVGARVRVPKWKSLGTVTEIRGEQVRVAIDPPGGSRGSMAGMTMLLAWSDVESVEPASKPQAREGGVAWNAEVAVEGRLDLRGQRFDDAMSALEVYLDRAFRSGRREVTVIHGFGTGALREGSRALLKRTPFVKNYRDGGSGEGGAGATIIEFDVD